MALVRGQAAAPCQEAELLHEIHALPMLGLDGCVDKEVSEVLCLGPVYYSSFSSDLPRRGSAPQFPPSRGVMGARSPHSEGVSLIC